MLRLRRQHRLQLQARPLVQVLQRALLLAMRRLKRPQFRQVLRLK